MNSQRNTANLTDRLRGYGNPGNGAPFDLMHAAADEIERLRGLLRERCLTCKGTGIVMGDTDINSSCQYECPDCAGGSSPE